MNEYTTFLFEGFCDGPTGKVALLLLSPQSFKKYGSSLFRLGKVLLAVSSKE